MFCKPTNLADPRLGAEVVFATDDFFAVKERLIEPKNPIFVEDKYDENGKWMDGWESRRRRDDGHDHAIVRLGAPAKIHEVEIDTAFFTGNFPPAASLEVTNCADRIPSGDVVWDQLIEPTALRGNHLHTYENLDCAPITHVRLSIFPDGGIARLRLFGCFLPTAGGSDANLADARQGARAVCCNDQHFGSFGNILLPTKPQSMAEGWETRRRREPGYDWGILELARPGTVSEVIVDTSFFKGNFPHRISVQGACLRDVADAALPAASHCWPYLLPEVSLSADSVSHFAKELPTLGPVSHARINLIPDGGISRLYLLSNFEERDKE